MADTRRKWAEFLATNIQTLRTAKGWSQTRLAAVAKLPRSTVTNLESGSSNPSLTVLESLTLALGVGVDELISEPKSDIQHVKFADLKVKKRGGFGVTIRSQLPEPVRGIEIDRMLLQSDRLFQGSPHLPGTREFLICFRGEVKVYVAGEAIVLSAGDVLAFPGDQAHSYRAGARAPADCISVVVMDSRNKTRQSR